MTTLRLAPLFWFRCDPSSPQFRRTFSISSKGSRLTACCHSLVFAAAYSSKTISACCCKQPCYCVWRNVYMSYVASGGTLLNGVLLPCHNLEVNPQLHTVDKHSTLWRWKCIVNSNLKQTADLVIIFLQNCSRPSRGNSFAWLSSS